MAEPNQLMVTPTEGSELGPLDGPFTLSIDVGPDVRHSDVGEELVALVVDFVRLVAAGVSCYNSNDFEQSSNLRSYAAECIEDLKLEAPDAALRLEGLVFDCTRLPDAVKAHPIWRLDRAILRALPRVTFID